MRPSRWFAAGILLLAGCASQDAPQAESSAEPAVGADVEPGKPVLFPELPASAAIERLRDRAAEQSARPTPVKAAPAWLPESQHIAPDAMDHAAASLESVLEPIRAQPRFVNPSPPPTEASPEDRDQSLRLYARGRLARADGNSAEALSAFESASRLDPASPQIWRALGDAQLAAGLRSSGLRSFQIAAERGLDDVRAWALIGLEAVRRRDTEHGVRWLVAARDGLKDSADPVAVSWIEVSLGELLLSQQRVHAGAALLRSALTRPVTDSSRSAFASEYATLVRRRPHLWLRAGDASALIGDWDEAADAYDRAERETTDDLAETISRRRAAVLIASGRSAEASLALLDRVRRTEGRIGEEDLRTLGQLGAREPELEAAVADLSRSLAPVWPSVRSRLLLARLVAADGPISVDSLDADVRLSPKHAVALLRHFADDVERWNTAQELTLRRPADAEAIADALFAGGLVRGTTLAELSSGGDLLSLRVRLRMGRPDRSIDLDAGTDSVELQIARIETATRLGRWDEARRLVAPLENPGGITAARALSAAQLSGRALAAWQQAVMGDAGPEELLLGARLALENGNNSDAASLLLRAHALDPGDDRIYERMLGLLRSPTAFEGRPEVEEAVRSMRTHAPDSVALEAIEIAQIHQREFVAEAGTRAQLLIDRLPAPTLADYSALLSLWHEAEERADTTLLETAEAWLLEGLDAERPTEARAIALASLVALRGTPQEGLAVLTSLPLARTPTVVQAMAELLVQDGKPEDAYALLRELYDHPSLAVADVLQLALVELQQHGSLDSSLDAMASVPADIEIQPQDLPTLIALCNALMSQMVGRQTGSPATLADGLQYAAVTAFALDRGASLPEPYHRVRLRSLAQSARTPHDEITRAAAQMHDALGRVNDATFEDVFGLLIESGRTQDAVLWAAEIVMLDAAIDPQRWTAVAIPLASMGTLETVEVVLDRLQGRGMLAQAIEALAPGTPDEPRGSTNHRAELSYLLAGIAGSRERDAQAMELYRLTLREQPDHPWACNDYGYMLVDRGENLDEAERLLEAAYTALPDRTSVLDSIGWLRYKQGRFVEPDGGGARALLERAAGSLDGSQNATILDHLGDVRWMTGDAVGAIDAWERAETIYLQNVRDLNSPDLRRLPLYSRLQARLGLLRDKLRLAEVEGGEPPVARTPGERIIDDE